MEKLDKLINVLLILAVLKAVWRIGIMNSAILVVATLIVKTVVMNKFFNNN